ncbi:glycosyl hydrolase [Streptomyces sp. B6B3]|uniref:glycoside hydrolase family 26 protein n=1 Tax=Streptomyces sp. B6B3 TaxID=3153570 RepID=UPI00325D0783
MTVSGSSTAGAAPQQPDCPLNEIYVPECGVLWGIYTETAEGRNPYTSVLDLESDIGRQFDFVHRYHDFSNQGSQGRFPDQWEQQLGADDERMLLINWTTRIHGTDERVSWDEVDSGAYDESVIRPVAQRLKDWGKPVFLAFDHEAEGNRRPGQGDGWDYVQAWRHIYDVFEQMGVDNVVWTWLHVGWTGHEETTPNFYPGDDYVDWIGYDPFNYYVCRDNEWRSPGEAFGTWYNWLQRNGFDHKPIMLGEYGTVADPENEWAQAEWYRNLVPALEKYPNIKAVAQFNTYKHCDTRVSTRPDVLEAFADAGRHDYVTLDR